ncbi:MAG: ABC transporter ATP-binding protein [Planctomycetota bacterium]
MKLGQGGDGRASTREGAASLEGDGGGDPLHRVHGGPVHALEELPRVGREGLHVPPLTFGIQRVEGQARLAAARDARHHGHAPDGDVQVDAAQVVLARSAQPDDVSVGHGREVYEPPARPPSLAADSPPTQTGRRDIVATAR